MKNFIRKKLTQIKDFFTAGGRDADIKALLNLDSLLTGQQYIPWTQSALRPAAIEMILNDIIVHDRKKIIECGSGISTLYIASLLKKEGLSDGKIYSIDHDSDWIKKMEVYIERFGLSDHVQFIHAPLESFSDNFGSFDWYKTSVLDDYLTDIKIDQLIVDGPPAYEKNKRYSRYPAGPYFKGRFSKNFSVFLDDTNRRGEKRIAEEWSNILGLSFNHDSRLDLAVAIKGKQFNIH